MQNKLNKDLILSLIKEMVYTMGTGNASAPVADYRSYDPDDVRINYEEQTERIVGLIHDMTKSVREGLKNGSLTSGQIAKVVDFQFSRIKKAIEYAEQMSDAYEGEDLDMTTPEI